MFRNLPDIDERARRTRDSLARALMAVSRDKPVDAITVGELTKAAGIGRSTFYTHFTSLPDFLKSSYASMLERSMLLAQQDSPSDVLPCRLIVQHMANSREFAGRVRQSRAWPAMICAGQARLVKLVEANLDRQVPDLDPDTCRWAATFITAGFMGLIERWSENGRIVPPDEIENVFAQFCGSLVASLQPAPAFPRLSVRNGAR